MWKLRQSVVHNLFLITTPRETERMEKYFSDIKVWVKNLTVACPMQYALNDCPFRDLRELPLAERLSAVDEMSLEQLKMITQHHSKCLHLREG